MARMLGIGTLATVATAACGSDCDRAGCDALHQRARDDGAAHLAGVIAHESDVVANSCQECGMAEDGTQILAWPRTGEITEDTLGTLQGLTPVAGIALSSQGRYKLDIAPGDYVVCVAKRCYNLTVSDHITTFNVRLTYGPGEGYLAQGDGEFTKVSPLNQGG